MNRNGSNSGGSPPDLSAEILGIARRIERARGMGGGASRVLAELVEEDPLDMRDRCASWLTREAILLDLERTRFRCLTWIVYRADLFEPGQDPEEWLDARVVESAKTLVDEEIELYYQNPEFDMSNHSAQARYWLMTRTLGIQACQVLRAINAFNTRPRLERRVFLGIVQERQSATDLAVEQELTRAEVLAIFEGCASLIGVESRRQTGFLAEAGGGDHE